MLVLQPLRAGHLSLTAHSDIGLSVSSSFNHIYLLRRPLSLAISFQKQNIIRRPALKQTGLFLKDNKPKPLIRN